MKSCGYFTIRIPAEKLIELEIVVLAKYAYMTFNKI